MEPAAAVLPDLRGAGPGLEGALRAAASAVEAEPQQLGVEAFGGPGRWQAWLSQLAALEEASEACRAPSLWSLVAALSQAVPIELFTRLVDAAAAPARRRAVAAAAASPAAASAQGGTGERARPCAEPLGAALVAAAGRLAEAQGTGGPGGVGGGPPADSLVEGFAACAALLGCCPPEGAPALGRAAEAWLRAALAAQPAPNPAAQRALEQHCLGLVQRAQAAAAGPLLNVAWRLAKALCLEPRCSPAAAAEALRQAARAAAAVLAALPAGAGRQEALFVAKFHSSNFMRVARDSPALAAAGFPLRDAAEALAPLAAERPGRGTEGEGPQLLERMLAMSLERWVACGGLAGDADDAAIVVQSPEVAEALVPAALRLLASGAAPLPAGAALGDVPPERRRAACLAAAALGALEELAGGAPFGEPSAATVAAVLAAGAPSAPGRLASWAASENPRLYALALRVHRALPECLGADGSFAWADLLVDVMMGLSGSRPVGRAQCQLAACVATLLAGCPLGPAAAWAREALAPLAATEGSAPPAKALWVLLRRVGGVLAAGPEGGALLALAERAARLDPGSSEGDCAQAPPAALRALAALVRAGAPLHDEAASRLGARLRRLLGLAGLSVALRAQAWAAHAEVCLRCGPGGPARDDLRVAIRYALKHLSGRAAAGACVAGVLARAPGGMLGGAAPALEGLCGSPWPLRAGGLAAAAAVCDEEEAPGAAREAAQSAADAFAEEHGAPHAAGWANAGEGLRAKRRRLLRELAALPQELPGPPGAEAFAEQQFLALCAGARARLDAWSLAHARG